ncbi:MAG: hypothetical protein NT083_09205 [Rhodocyclales bacterium]|nr:hypothetical protein [Rhodocyclales bacterium]
MKALRIVSITLGLVLALLAVGNGVALRQNLAGVSINPLMKDLAEKDLVEGRGNVTFENLAYKIEFGSLVSDVARARVEEKKAEIKAKDKLKSLFGR